MLSARPRARPCWRGARARRTAAVAGLQVAGLQVAGGTEQPTRGSVTTNSRVRYNQLGGPIQPTRGSVTANSGVRYSQLRRPLLGASDFHPLAGPLQPTRGSVTSNSPIPGQESVENDRVGRDRGSSWSRAALSCSAKRQPAGRQPAGRRRGTAPARENEGDGLLRRRHADNRTGGRGGI